MEPAAFSEVVWMLVVQSNAVPSRTQLGNTCREWYWHVRRLEHWRFWQVVMADFSTFPGPSRLSVLWTHDRRRYHQWIQADEVTAREQHEPGVTHPQTKFGCSRDFRGLALLKPCLPLVGDPRGRDFVGKCVARDSSFDHRQCQEPKHIYFIFEKKKKKEKKILKKNCEWSWARCFVSYPQPPLRRGHGCTVGIDRDPPV